MTSTFKPLSRILMLGALAVSLSACNALTRMANIGSEPPLSPIDNPVTTQGYQPVSLPMPRPEPALQQANSLWRPGSKAFFKDQRANQVGDILTVLVKIEDKAMLNNSTDTSRTSSENAGFAGLLGLETQVTKVLPEGTSASGLVDLGSDHSVSGSGASGNTIQSSKIAEARIAYGGRGHLTDVQQARYGQQLFDIIFPF